MKTFLAQNQFGTPIPCADEAGASSPAPTPDAPADLSVSVALPSGPVAAETAVTAPVRTVAADLTNHIGEIFRGAKALFEPYPIPRLALPRFFPDYEGMEAAINDPEAPRALETDPVWVDEAPLFLKETS